MYYVKKHMSFIREECQYYQIRKSTARIVEKCHVIKAIGLISPNANEKRTKSLTWKIYSPSRGCALARICRCRKRPRSAQMAIINRHLYKIHILLNCIKIIMSPLAQKYVSLKCRYFVLKTAVVFYLVPFSYYKYYILGIIRSHFPGLWERISPAPEVLTTEDLIIIGGKSVGIPEKTKWLLILMLIMVITAFLMICRQALQYLKMKKICLSIPQKEVSQKQKELFFKIKDEVHVKKNVKFICSKSCRSPMTSGVLSPTVIFPVWDEDRMDAASYGYLIKHELVHIKHHDLLIKLLGILVMAVHWFNPFSYFLYFELSNISEMYCDSVVMHGKDRRERSQYGGLILKLAAENRIGGRDVFFAGIADGRNKMVYKRRILEIMTNKKYKIILSAIMSGFVCMAGGITTFAYDSPNIFVDDAYDVGDEIMIFEGSFSIYPRWDELPSDYFFVDDHENIYDVNDDVNGKSKAHCRHQYISGTVVRHIKDGKGGCTITEHSSQKCSLCGDIIIGRLLRTLTSPQCTH